VLLFALDDSSLTTASSEYATAVVFADLCAAVAHADGTVSEGERDHLLAHLGRFLDLGSQEQVRLRMHVRWLTSASQGLTGFKRRIERLPAGRREEIGQCLIQIALADGIVTPDEIRTLVKLFSWLGLEESRVYSGIHSGGEVAAKAIVSSSDASVVQLDPKKIADRIEETEAVTSMLSDIFKSEDLPAETSMAVPDETSVGAQAGIKTMEPGSQISALTSQLRTRSSWSRTEAETLATSLGLPMLDAAIDRVNEEAIEMCGEPLIEGEDPLLINSYAAGEMFS
jgi:uncharacterized tellurite resistance protein B-like protein